RGRGLVGGNTRFQNNTVSTSDNTYFAVYSAIYGVSIEAGVNTSYDHRDYKIVGNEFHGLTAGVLASGYSAANPTVKKLLIAHNHDIVSASGASYPGTLASLTNVQGVTIEGNVVGQPGLLTTATAVALSGVTHAVLRGNLVMNTNVTAYGISDSNQISISDTFRDVGKGSTGNQAILLWNSQNVSVVGSSAVQTGSYAATFLQEAGGSDFNAANANFVRGFTTKYMPAGANTTFGTLN
ncbi:hypothetical protein, partial [Enterovirga sp. CN4-39]|uniref:hypothetical protein n=1 Tax=Enterovirga sp. CN4-39 TaxID=3400910 RepID=UPI003C03A0A9